MKRTMGILGLIFIAALLVATGRPADDKGKPDAAELQGTWKGHEIGDAANGACSLIFSGKHIEYKGTDTNDWDKGTFTINESTTPQQMAILITACPDPQYVGKTSHVIYEIKDHTLTIAGNEPGKTNAPTSFDAAEARKFVFKKE
jgi:uncharacterized protein (TIGR03067 family)